MSHTLVVLISGSGTNLQALIDAQETDIPAKIVHVVSNRQKAFGLQRAERANIPTTYHNLLKYKKKELDEQKARAKYDKDLADIILDIRPSLVVCAGWMHILAPTFLGPLAESRIPVINLHPALPGQFNGM
jgi:phosphoribosylglycinamide formyltransferase